MPAAIYSSRNRVCRRICSPPSGSRFACFGTGLFVRGRSKPRSSAALVAVDAPGNDDLFRPRAASFALLVISQRQALSPAAVLPRSGAADLAACGILEAVNGRFPTTWVRASTDRPTVLLVDDHR